MKLRNSRIGVLVTTYAVGMFVRAVDAQQAHLGIWSYIWYASVMRPDFNSTVQLLLYFHSAKRHAFLGWQDIADAVLSHASVEQI